MAAPYRVQARGAGQRSGLANEPQQPSGIPVAVMDAISRLLEAIGAEPITASMPENELVAMLDGVAHAIQKDTNDQQSADAASVGSELAAAAMSNRSPRQRLAAVTQQESRLEIAKRVAARTGRPVAEVLRYVP